jgi:hypothetical protein
MCLEESCRFSGLLRLVVHQQPDGNVGIYRDHDAAKIVPGRQPCRCLICRGITICPLLERVVFMLLSPLVRRGKLMLPPRSSGCKKLVGIRYGHERQPISRLMNCVFRNSRLSHSHRKLLQQRLDLRLSDDLALFHQDRCENLVGSERVGQDDAQDGEFLAILRHAEPGPGDESLARFTLVLLQQLADLVEEGIDDGPLLGSRQ